MNALAKAYVSDWEETAYAWEPLYLNCARLTQLPALPPKLQILFVCGNLFKDFGTTSLPASLKEFHCDHNTELKQLGPSRLPPNLTVLSCGNCSLTTLGALPASLKILDCTSNPLLTLPTPLPPKLQRLASQCAPLCPLPPSLRSFAYYGTTPLPYALPTKLQLLRAASVDLFTACTDVPPEGLSAYFADEDPVADWKTAWARSAAQAHARYRVRCRVLSPRLPVSALVYV